MKEKPVANLLRNARKNSGLKVDEVIRTLKDKYDITISSKTLYGYEVGRSQPEIDCFFYLCDIYHVSPNIIENASESDTSESEADVQKRIRTLSNAFESCGYIAPGTDLTDDQLKFCIGLVDFLDIYFG